ncbi:SDR family oxidoreductase [Zavarzinia compransoris]|uniref:SDR family oxidoreductase n=1 Tax=Zavarzinia marina TaxID=2911065 RepID=UPI001F28BD6D|nr:SDR family oxidoreductase [Zavarzinia marina]MCF4166151.1 SDR family oxidoreductase [Zavarzinia marina]
MSVKSLFDLSGKVALVTGGSRGLGLQMAEALGELGAKVAIAARKPAELEAAEAKLTAMGVETLSVPVDLGDLSGGAVQRLVEAVMARFGRIDILVNNAGATWGATAEDYPEAAWRKVMTLNIDAVFALSQAVGKRAFIPQGGGKVINIASIAGLGGNPPNLSMFTIAYNTSKGAVVNFTRALAAEWGRYNINVNAICPGFFPSKMSQGLLDRFEQQVVEATPLGRLGGDEDMMGAVAFLASDASRHVTGQMLAVDGGVSAT